ncbi:sulfite exporter TauE/SafE family protein, partial [Actinomadura bangladeshensis]
MAGLEPWALAALVLIGLAAGVGITAVGPGGVLVTVGLFAFT